MRIIKFALLFVFCLVAASAASGQAVEVGEDDFYEIIRGAFSQTRETPRRETSKEESYTKGKLNYMVEIVDEFLNDNLRRFLSVTKYADRTETFEQIIVGEDFYCRSNNGGWMKSTESCRSVPVTALSGETVSEFTVENTRINKKAVKLYRHYMTYGEDANDPAYQIYAYWIDANGFLVRRENENGLVKSKLLYDKLVVIYEYNPKNLKIAAPVLKAKSKRP